MKALYQFDIDEEGITAICRNTGERSNITNANGIAELLGFEIDDDGFPTADLPQADIADKLANPSVLAEVHKRLAEDREAGSWHDN